MEKTITTTCNQKNKRVAQATSVTQVIDLGKATVLTLGVGVSKMEGRRPFGCWKNTK